MSQLVLLFLLVLFSCGFTFVSSQITTTILGDNQDLIVYKDGFYLAMFWITPKGVIAFDAPPNTVATAGMTIPEMIAQHTSKKIKWFVYSHHHLDHVGGAVDFPSDIEYICSKDAANAIKKLGLPECTMKIKDPYTLTIDEGYTVEFTNYGFVHTPGNMAMYLPSHKFLMYIDVVFPGWGPYHSLGMAGTLLKHQKAHKKILAYDFEYLLGGHVDRLGTREDVENSLQFFKDLKESAKYGMENADFMAAAVENGGFTGTNSWTIFNAYTDQIVDMCEDKMLNEYDWDSKLLNVQPYLRSHCFYVYEFLEIGY